MHVSQAQSNPIYKKCSQHNFDPLGMGYIWFLLCVVYSVHSPMTLNHRHALPFSHERTHSGSIWRPSLKREVRSPLLRGTPEQTLSPSPLACQLVQEYTELKRRNVLKHHFRSILEYCRERQRISKFATDIQASVASSQRSSFLFTL